MDGRHFDRVSRSVGKQTDRRGMFKALAVGTLSVMSLGALHRDTRAAAGAEGDQCFTNRDCETGLQCEGASNGLLGGLIASGQYGPPFASSLFGPTPGRCRYRSDNCAKSGQYCDRDSDCCNGFNLECRGHECQRR